MPVAPRSLFRTNGRSLYIYDKAFRNSLGGDYGEATAVSVLLAIVLAVLSWLYFKLTDRWSTT